MYYITARKDNNSMELAKNIISYLNKKKIDFVVDKNLNITGNKKKPE